MKSALFALALVLLPSTAFADDGGSEAGADAGPTCVDGVLTVDGKMTTCAPYGCSDTACKTTCASASDCASGYVCEGGKCIFSTAPVCTSDGTASVSADGETISCAPYFCFDGFCRTRCGRPSDCSGKYTCDYEVGRCVDPASIAPASSESCAFGASAPGAFAAAIFLAALVARTRRS